MKSKDGNLVAGRNHSGEGDCEGSGEDGGDVDEVGCEGVGDGGENDVNVTIGPERLLGLDD